VSAACKFLAHDRRARSQGFELAPRHFARQGHHAAVGAGIELLRRDVFQCRAQGLRDLLRGLHFFAGDVDRAYHDVLALEQADQFQRHSGVGAFERYLVDNGITVLKFFLNVSKQEQKQRFLQRIDRPDKNWKFSAEDVKERGYWDQYMAAYEDTLNHTSTDWAPWYVLPADHKWFTRLAAAEIISHALRAMRPAYPEVTPEQKGQLQEARQMLESAD